LVAWVWSTFVSLVGFFAQYFTKKFALVAAAITSFTAILLGFKLAIESAISGLISFAPTGVVLFGLQLLPSNTGNCITALATAYTASQIYIYWRNIIAFRLTG
jgi:hypothetical protein